jgi:hypothetical protein
MQRMDRICKEASEGRLGFGAGVCVWRNLELAREFGEMGFGGGGEAGVTGRVGSGLLWGALTLAALRNNKLSRNGDPVEEKSSNSE